VIWFDGKGASGLSLMMDDTSNVAEIRVTDARYTTNAGIKVGARVAALAHAYADLACTVYVQLARACARGVRHRLGWSFDTRRARRIFRRRQQAREPARRRDPLALVVDQPLVRIEIARLEARCTASSKAEDRPKSTWSSPTSRRACFAIGAARGLRYPR
jgi:hypothetical protein